MTNSFCYRASSYYVDAIFAYPRGKGYSFYWQSKYGESFICWFKGNKEKVCGKMDKKIESSY